MRTKNQLLAVLALISTVVRSASPQTPTLLASLGDGFKSESATINGTSIHYLRGGSGPDIVLVRGFPEDGYEFHRIMPVPEKYTVIAVDLRSVGDSAGAPVGYDAAKLAEDPNSFLPSL